MKPTNQPQVKLKGIEYLLLAIQSDPGKSQRHYLRRLYQYLHGVPSHNNGGTNNSYFTSIVIVVFYGMIPVMDKPSMSA
jgi:hypothetical protein